MVSQSNRGSVPREGVGLLQGRVVCGIYGARMRVLYQAVSGKLEPYYICTENAVRRAGKPCQPVRGSAIDDAIGALILDSVTPVAIELTLAIEDEIAGRIEQAATQRVTQLTRARYDNELGLKNWRGEPFTSKKVLVIRNAYHLKSRFERLRERGLLIAQEMATQLDVCPTTIYSWAHDGFLREHRYGNEHRCLYEPVENVTISKGQGGRKATPPIFMNDLTRFLDYRGSTARACRQKTQRLSPMTA